MGEYQNFEYYMLQFVFIIYLIIICCRLQLIFIRVFMIHKVANEPRFLFF